MTSNVFALPDLGEGLTEAELVRWLVSTGDEIAVDTPLAEVETAKATVEVSSPYSGIVSELHSHEGDTIAVGAPMVSFADDGHDDSEPPTAATDTSAHPTHGHSCPVLIGYGARETAPSRRRRRASSTSTSTSTRSATLSPDTELGPPTLRPVVQSPAVRNLAHRSGLDLTAVTGTGPNGLITRHDVEIAAQRPTSEPTGPSNNRWSDPAWHEAEAIRLGSCGSARHQDERPVTLAHAQLHATLAVALRLRRAEESRGVGPDS